MSLCCCSVTVYLCIINCFVQYQQHLSPNMYGQKPIYSCILLVLALYWHLQWDGTKLEEFRTFITRLYPPQISSPVTNYLITFSVSVFVFLSPQCDKTIIFYTYCMIYPPIWIPSLFQNHCFIYPLCGITNCLYPHSVTEPPGHNSIVWHNHQFIFLLLGRNTCLCPHCGITTSLYPHCMTW